MPSATGTSGTCTVTFTALPGPTTFSGTLTASGNAIAHFSQTTIVTPGSANSVNFTANPVVSSVVLQLAVPSVNAGTPSNTLLTVNAYDANSKIIAGIEPYVDSAGNPVSLSLSVSNAQAGGQGLVVLRGPTLIRGPVQGAIYAHYDGRWLQSATISVASSSSVVTTLTGATLTTTPTAYNYPATLANPEGIVTGPDGNLWFTPYSQAKIGRITPAGVVSTFTIPSGGFTTYLCVGPDGNLWFTEGGGTKIGKITVGGTITEYPTGLNPVNYAGITVGPDGNLWFTSLSPDSIDSVSTTGTVKIHTTGLTGVWGPGGLTLGPDGNLWSQDGGHNTVVRTTPAGVSTEFTYPGAAALNTYGQIVVGPDGNLWFTTADGTAVGESTPNGQIFRYTSGLNPSATLDGITVGPDGNVWFADFGTPSAIGVINLATKQSTEYTNGIPANGQPSALTVGPDGNLWVGEFNTNQITKFVY